MHSKIKILSLTLWLIFCVSGGLRAQSGFYDPSVIREVRLYFTQPDWDYILDSLFTAGQQGRIIASVCIDGTCLDSVGVRYKGFSSVNTAFVKNPFNIDLDMIIPGQNYMGVNKLKLGNVIHDPSFVREVLAYEIARNYMPASQANYANVYVNDTLIGLYTSIETVNKPFCERNFGSGNNPFFKGDPAVLEFPLGSNANLQYYDDDTTLYYPYYSLESDAGWKELLHFIDILNNYPDSLPHILNIDRTLWMHAFNYAIVNLDSYIAYAQNYYIYQDDYQRFNPVLWDMNMSFGSFRNSDASTNALSGLTINQAKNLNPLGLLTYCIRPRPLITVLLQNPTYKKMYMAHIRTIVQEIFQSNWYYTRAQELQQMIDAHVQQDTNRFYTYNQFLLNIDTTVTSSLSYPGIKDFMTARSNYLSNYAGFQNAPQITEITVSNPFPNPNDFVWFNARIAGHDSCFMAYRYNAGGPFTKVMMYDDGLHNDGAPGDSIFGAQVQMNGSYFQYYFYAQNTTSGIFSPARAEFEYYSLSPVTSGNTVVINEFMASNESYVWDNYYEYDDWIELYNNSSADISLNHVCLTDNVLSLSKWQFPDTIIRAHSYLIVWADDQAWQNGLHASFKLSNTGEALFMTYNGLTIIDSVSFGSQTMDWSWGRFPNGTGPFGLMHASFAATNFPTSSVNSIADDEMIRVFPNPATNMIYIQCTENENFSAELLTSLGNIVYKSETGTQILSIPTEFLPRGMYFARITVKGKTRVKKIILQ
jgi:hypothetical protein